MATGKLNLTRDQLATFLKTHEQIKQFEALFKVADSIAPDVVNEIKTEAGNAMAAANEALAQIVSLASDVDAAGAYADQKASQALAQLESIAQSLALIATSQEPQNNNATVTDYIDLSAAPHVNRIRRLAWNSVDQAPEIGMDHDVTQQIGLEWYARIGNATASTITNGSVVGFAGATPDALLVQPYLADGAQPSLYILGVMTHDLLVGEKGYATVWGFVRDLDTSAFSAGDILYASPSVSGGLTNSKPTAPENVIPVAACITSNATTGVIFVRPTIEQQKYYGIFTKTTDQSPAVINTEYLLTFDNTQISDGVVIGTPASRIVVAESGLYNFDATLQLTSGSASSKNTWIWFKKNGAAVANSARIVTSDINNGYVPVALSQFFSLTAGDYIEIAFAADDTNVTVDAVAATAFAPAAPSVVLNVTQVQQ